MNTTSLKNLTQAQIYPSLIERKRRVDIISHRTMIQFPDDGYLKNPLYTSSVHEDMRYWFENTGQAFSSYESNTLQEDWKHWKAHISYSSPSFHGIPIPSVKDNTEGIGGVSDLWIPPGSTTLVDVGGGRSDSTKYWLESYYPNLTVYVIDPFLRDRCHNEKVQQIVCSAGGADVTTSLSVLNVIDNSAARIRHIRVMFDALKPGGIAYFKVWAGLWPNRGSGVPDYDTTRRTFQANAWADKFIEDVAVVFSDSNVQGDNNRNLIIAKKF